MKVSRAIVITLLAGVMVLSGLSVPGFYNEGAMTAYAAAKEINVSSWAQLKDEVEKASSGSFISAVLTDDLVSTGSIEIPSGVKLAITAGSSKTINPGVRDKYESMFVVSSGATLNIEQNITLSGKRGPDQTCPDETPYTKDMFTGDADDKTYNPKGFFIHVKEGGTATLNGTISDFVTSRAKSDTPRYVAPVVAYGENATFNIGGTGVIKNNLVGYIVDDSKANNDAQSIKQYVKGAPPNVPRVPKIATQKANSGNYEGRTRASNAGIDGDEPGSGITATAGAVIYKDGAKGKVEGTIENNRGDTGGIMSSGTGSSVTITGAKALITKNVGVQFGGGSTVEQGGGIYMNNGKMSKNVAWFGGGAVYATENGVDWLLGRIDKGDGVSPNFAARKDGEFFMEGGELTENTAFTRGGAILADSDGVNIQQGKLTYNMGRMLGGAMYVMGDHPKYEYTVQMTGLYVHDNASVSGEQKARNAVASRAPSSTILSDKWKPGDADTLTWDHLDAPMDTLLQAPTPCGDAGNDILSDNVTGGKAKGNTDDWTDGTGAQGTGGGVWLCAYGNTIFDANKPDEVIITNNWATGAPGEPYNPSGAYHKTLSGSDLADAKVNSASSDASRSGVAGGSDFHADTGGKGTVVINGLTHARWKDENKNEKYESTVSNGRLNLVNENPTAMRDEALNVEVYGNLSRHGGGLAADGTYIFGTAGDQATPSASLKVEKKWANSVQKAPVTIRVIADTNKGKAVLADVPLDGEANAPETEFDTIEELAPTGNTWNGRFAFPMTADAENGTAKLYTLVYTGEDIYINDGFTLTAGMELDPLDYRGKQGLGAAIKAANGEPNPAVKVLFGQPEYADEDSKPKIIKKNGDSYSVTPITIKFEEYKDNGDGDLIPCKDFIYTPGEIDFENIDYEITATPHYETTYEDGQIIETNTVLYNIYLFEIPLRAPMTNDNWPITEKYVNKQVHENIENFDQDFEYDIMAYVPETATEFTISDTLVKGLEFADKDGKATTDPKEAVRAIKVKGANNHLPGEDGTVSAKGLHTNNGNEIDFIAWAVDPRPGFGGKYYPDMSIEDNTLSVTFNHSTPADNKVFGINGANEKWVPGRWIQVTFGARIKDEYRTIDDLKALKAEVSGKSKSWEDDTTNKQAPDAKTITYANGDLGLVAALASAVGPDPVIWAVKGPSRLFARTSKGDYYATSMGDLTGDTWTLIDKDLEETDETGPFGSKTWKNADNRYNGRSPDADNTKEVIDVDKEDTRLDALKAKQKILGQELVKGAEGGSRLFVQTKDINGDTTHIYATPNNDKSGATWNEITSADGDVYINAINRLKPDSGTIRMLDLETTTTTLSGESINWPVISDETHEGMANQGKFNVKFGNGAKGTYKTNTVTVNPESVELTVTKKWVDAKTSEIPSPEDFKSFLVLKSVKKNEDEEIENNISEDNRDKLTVTKNNDGSYTAKWTGLPKLKSTEYSYEFDEKKMPGFTTDIDKDTNTITNTKNREEKPEIEKYVNQAVHKDIKLDEVFTYDIIAYVTKDADSVTITDKLNDVLTFVGKAEDVKVVDLGEEDNHLVTNNTSGNKVNDNASVAQEGKAVDAAKVTIEGQDLKVSITNSMKPITEYYNEVSIKYINPKLSGYFEKEGEEYKASEDTKANPEKKYYELSYNYNEKTVAADDPLTDLYVKEGDEYVLTEDTTPRSGTTYYERSESYDEVQIEYIKPKDEEYYEKTEDGYTPSADEKANPEKTYYVKQIVEEESMGYEYDGDDQPVTALRGHWVKVTFKAKIKAGLTVDDAKKAFAEIKNDQVEDRAEENIGNAPVVSAENHTGIPNNAKYSIGVANKDGIQDDVYADMSNTVTVKPSENSGDEGSKEENDEDVAPDKEEEKVKGKGVPTGDNNTLILWAAMLMLSSAATIIEVLRRRVRRF